MNFHNNSIGKESHSRQLMRESSFTKVKAIGFPFHDTKWLPNKFFSLVKYDSISLNEYQTMPKWLNKIRVWNLGKWSFLIPTLLSEQVWRYPMAPIPLKAVGLKINKYHKWSGQLQINISTQDLWIGYGGILKMAEKLKLIVNTSWYSQWSYWSSEPNEEDKLNWWIRNIICKR